MILTLSIFQIKTVSSWEKVIPSPESELKLKTFLQTLRKNLQEFHNMSEWEIIQSIVGCVIAFLLFLHSLWIKRTSGNGANIGNGDNSGNANIGNGTIAGQEGVNMPVIGLQA